MNPGYPFIRDNIFIQVTEDLYIGDYREISIICDVRQMSDRCSINFISTDNRVESLFSVNNPNYHFPIPDLPSPRNYDPD